MIWSVMSDGIGEVPKSHNYTKLAIYIYRNYKQFMDIVVCFAFYVPTQILEAIII